MKKLFLSAFSLCLLALGFTNAAVLQDAIQRGYENGLTSFNTSSTFRPYDTLRRDEAAKFFMQFTSTQRILRTPARPSGTNTNCNFYDIDKSRADLKTYVESACMYGFIKGSNGYVTPNQTLTNAQAVTITVRILDDGTLQSESGVSHRADNYYKRAMELKLDISGLRDKDAAATRGNVITLLYNAANGASNGGTSANNDVNSILKQLVDMLE